MPFAICAILVLAAVAPALAYRRVRWGGWALALAIGAVGTLLGVAGLRPGETSSFAVPWLPELDVSLAFRLDGLSLFFALLVTIIGALVTLYAWSYLAEEPERGRAMAALLAFMAAMLGLVVADDLVVLYVFWELTSVCSWLLIGFHHRRAEARRASWQALLVTAAGGLAMLAGFLLLAGAAGTWRVSRIVAAAPGILDDPRLPWASGLIVAGILTKSAQVPFHGWLPKAMEAPTPVSAYLHAATMVKAGIYLALRLVPVLGASAPYRWGLLAAGAVSLVAGSGRALFESDLKRVLAYSTVGALGLMLVLTAIGTPAAIYAALAYTLAHALYKGALFLAAGAVDHGAGTRDSDRLGGLWRRQPITAAAAALAAISMAGLPAGLGYAAKEAAYGGLLAGGHTWMLVVVVAGSALFVVSAAVSGWLPFVTRRGGPPAQAHEVSPAMYAPPLALAMAGIALGVAPGLADALLAPAQAQLAPGRASPLALYHGAPTAVLSLATLSLGALLVWGRPRARATLGPFVARVSLADGFRALLKTLDAVARRHTAALQTGSLRRYLLVTFGIAGALIAVAFVRSYDGPAMRTGAPRLPEIVLGTMAVAAAVAAVLSRTRLGAITALGAIGYAVGLIFLVFGAPDLAMTQIAVETLTVMVLLLAFRHLPRFGRFSSAASRARDLAVACTVGAGMALLVLLATAGRPVPVSWFHLARSVPEAHGRNVVNTTLVDFRALDTLGEVTVLAVAGFGIVALLKLRREGRRP